MSELFMGSIKTGSQIWPADHDLLTLALENNHLPFTEIQEWQFPQIHKHKLGKRNLVLIVLLKQHYCAWTPFTSVGVWCCYLLRFLRVL